MRIFPVRRRVRASQKRCHAGSQSWNLGPRLGQLGQLSSPAASHHIGKGPSHPPTPGQKLPTRPHPPEQSAKNRGPAVRADVVLHYREGVGPGSVAIPRPARPRECPQHGHESVSGPDAKSGLRAQGREQGIESVAGSQGDAARPRNHPHTRKTTPIRPCPRSRFLTGQAGKG